jgi:Domain of unknown function (DUF222)/HNH endonuclease
MFVSGDKPAGTELAKPGPTDRTTHAADGRSIEGELAGLPLEHLEHEITQLASHLASGMCRWLELVGEFDRREGWGSWAGVRSCMEWVSWRCALDPRSAREHVRVARSLRELPSIRGAFSRGELSYSKVRALTRVAEPDSEEELIELARHATAAQLERMLRAFRRVSDDEARDSHERRYLHHFWDEDGSLRVNARLPAEDGAQLLRALEAARESLEVGPGGGSAEPRDASAPIETQPENGSATAADCLVALAETALAAGPTPLAGGDRYQVVLHLDARTGEGRLDDGPVLAPQTARRLGCDAALVPLAEARGQPLSVGRRTRTIPAAIRRALHARDGGCQFPGCNNRRWVDAHHIRHWAEGGETAMDNLVLLCRRHHRLLHEGGYTIEREADGGVGVRHPRGWRIPNSPPLPVGQAGALKDGDGPLLTGTGERMDLRMAVDAVVTICG